MPVEWVPQLTLGVILTILAAVVIATVRSVRENIQEEAQKLYQPFLLDLKDLREEAKDHFYKIKRGRGATTPWKRSGKVFENEKVFIEDEIIDFYEKINEKLDKYEELGSKLHKTGGSYLRQKYGPSFAKHLRGLISSDPNLSVSLSAQRPAWVPSEKFILNEKPSDRQIEVFNNWKEEFPDMEECDPEVVYTELREILLEDEKVGDVLTAQEELLNETDCAIKVLDKYFLRGMWGKLKYIVKRKYRQTLI